MVYSEYLLCLSAFNTSICGASCRQLCRPLNAALQKEFAPAQQIKCFSSCCACARLNYFHANESPARRCGTGASGQHPGEQSGEISIFRPAPSLPALCDLAGGRARNGLMLSPGLSPGLVLARRCKGRGILHTGHGQELCCGYRQHPWGVQQPRPWPWGLPCRLQASERDQRGPVHGNPTPWRGMAGVGVIPASCFGRKHPPPTGGGQGAAGGASPRALPKVGLIFTHF